MENTSDQVWFITDYDSVWATKGLVEDVEGAAEAYPSYIFFYGPKYTVQNWVEIQSAHRRAGMLFPPTQMGDGIIPVSRA